MLLIKILEIHFTVLVIWWRLLKKRELVLGFYCRGINYNILIMYFYSKNEPLTFYPQLATSKLPKLALKDNE